MGLVGPNGAQAIEGMIQGAAHHVHSGRVAAWVGLATLLIGASAVFAQLQQSLNLIWQVKSKPGRGLWNLIRRRLLTFSMVVVIGFILLVTLIMSAAVSAVGKFLGGRLPGGEVLWHLINLVLSFSVSSVLFAAIFKVLPDVRLTWRDVVVGATVTAFLFDIGKFFIGLYLGRSSVASTYGAAGSLIIVLVWVFYAAAILLFGAEFTRVYATRGGRQIFPKDGAEFINQKELRQASAA